MQTHRNSQPRSGPVESEPVPRKRYASPPAVLTMKTEAEFLQQIDAEVLRESNRVGHVVTRTDVVKALALGAAAVLVGRPYLCGLSVAGSVGVAHVLRLLRGQLEMAMALTGCPTIQTINRSTLFQPAR